jgi:superkiller protein 3
MILVGLGILSKFLRKPLSLIPGAYVYYNLGNAYQKVGKYLESIESYRKTIEINPHWYEAYLNCGNSFDLMSNPQKALECYDQILNINPHYAAAYINKGNVLNK